MKFAILAATILMSSLGHSLQQPSTIQYYITATSDFGFELMLNSGNTGHYIDSSGSADFTYYVNGNSMELTFDPAKSVMSYSWPIKNVGGQQVQVEGDVTLLKILISENAGITNVTTSESVSYPGTAIPDEAISVSGEVQVKNSLASSTLNLNPGDSLTLPYQGYLIYVQLDANNQGTILKKVYDITASNFTWTLNANKTLLTVTFDDGNSVNYSSTYADMNGMILWGELVRPTRATNLWNDYGIVTQPRLIPFTDAAVIGKYRVTYGPLSNAGSAIIYELSADHVVIAYEEQKPAQHVFIGSWEANGNILTIKNYRLASTRTIVAVDTVAGVQMCLATPANCAINLERTQTVLSQSPTGFVAIRELRKYFLDPNVVFPPGAGSTDILTFEKQP